ncbi:g2919 [Coccomyxa elongata]
MRMPPTRRSTTVELPEHLWAKIASHMSTKDWAMVCGTCKTTFTLQPRTINIPFATPAAGVIWASKRLDGVEVLRLSPTGALGLAGTEVQDSNMMMSLKQRSPYMRGD